MRDDGKDGLVKGFALRRVSPATAAERQAREEGMLRALKVGARPYRDAAGKVAEQAVLAGKMVEANNLMVDKRRAHMQAHPDFPSNPGWLPRAESFRITPVPPSGRMGKP